MNRLLQLGDTAGIEHGVGPSMIATSALEQFSWIKHIQVLTVLLRVAKAAITSTEDTPSDYQSRRTPRGNGLSLSAYAFA